MIKVVTDSTCCLPQTVLKRLKITQIPVSILIEGQSYRDQIDLSTEDFYHRLPDLAHLPTTQQPSVDDFKALYESLLVEDPAMTIVSIHLSSTLSGTVASARAAAKALPKADIEVIDTQSFAMGLGLMVRQAGELAYHDASVASVLAAVQSVRDTLAGFLVVDTMEYLMKSGRIGRLRGTLARAMDIKPMLTLVGGEIKAHERFRGREEALNALAEAAIKAGQDASNFQVGIMHANCPDDAQQLATRLESAVKPTDLVIGEISGAIGASIGPGAIGVSWCAPT